MKCFVIRNVVATIVIFVLN